MGQNDSRQSETRSPFSRIVRVVAATLWLGAAAWVAWIAATRWSAVPAAFEEAAIEAVESEIEHGAAMFAILEAIPPPPPLPPPPEGMVWSMNSAANVDNAARGAWTPATRPGLRHLIEYFGSPQLESALSHLTELPLDAWRGYVRLNGAMAGGRAVRSASRLLAARARWHFAEHGDLDSAITDLNLIYRLAECGHQAGALLSALVAHACESLADSELRSLSQEFRLTRSQARTVVAMLRERALDPRDGRNRFMNALLDEWRWTMERAYTDDGHGNGWLVLSYSDHVLDPRRLGAARSGAWNALSPLFNSRKTVAEKVERIRGQYAEARGLSYTDARERLLANVSRWPFGILDGPIAFEFTPKLTSSLYGLPFQQCAEVRATIVTAALSAFRHDNGKYPESLSPLMGDYLGTVPNDPFVDRPFLYERKADDTYLLYSVGGNAIDDGGPVPFDRQKVADSKRNDDRDYSRPRGEPYNEPTLEKLSP